MEPLRAVWEVTAGLIPGQPIDKYTRRFPLTTAEWSDDVAFGEVVSHENADAYAGAQGKAVIYALSLMDPTRLNWVRLDWIWY